MPSPYLPVSGMVSIPMPPAIQDHLVAVEQANDRYLMNIDAYYAFDSG